MQSHRKLSIFAGIFLCAALQAHYASCQPQLPELPKGDYTKDCNPGLCTYDSTEQKLDCKWCYKSGAVPAVRAELKPVKPTDNVTYDPKEGKLLIVATKLSPALALLHESLPSGTYLESCTGCTYKPQEQLLSCLSCKGEKSVPFKNVQLKPVKKTDTVTYNYATGKLALISQALSSTQLPSGNYQEEKQGCRACKYTTPNKALTCLCPGGLDNKEAQVSIQNVELTDAVNFINMKAPFEPRYGFANDLGNYLPSPFSCEQCKSWPKGTYSIGCANCSYVDGLVTCDCPTNSWGLRGWSPPIAKGQQVKATPKDTVVVQNDSSLKVQNP